MRVVLDTNVLIAAFISRGHCNELLEHLARTHDLFTSEVILKEFEEKLRDKFRINARLVDGALELLRTRLEVVDPEPLPETVSADPDDDWILATALAARADCLVTGDSDLLTLGSYGNLPILAPGSFWGFEAGMESA